MTRASAGMCGPDFPITGPRQGDWASPFRGAATSPPKCMAVYECIFPDSFFPKKTSPQPRSVRSEIRSHQYGLVRRLLMLKTPKTWHCPRLAHEQPPGQPQASIGPSVWAQPDNFDHKSHQVPRGRHWYRCIGLWAAPGVCASPLSSFWSTPVGVALAFHHFTRAPGRRFGVGKNRHYGCEARVEEVALQAAGRTGRYPLPR